MDNLKLLITRIEKSTIQNLEKKELYDMISSALYDVVWPVVINHFPQETLDKLTSNKNQITPQSFMNLILASIKDPTTLKEIDIRMDDIIRLANEALDEEGVAK